MPKASAMTTFELQFWMFKLGAQINPIDGKWGPQTAGEARVLLARYKAQVHQRGSLQVAVEQLVMKIVGGLAVGPVDGLVGPVTEKARTHWTRGKWRDGLETQLDGDARFPAAVQNTWPTEDKMEEFYGAPGTNQVMLILPFPMVLAWERGTEITRFSINKKCHDSALRVYNRVLSDYGIEGIRSLGFDIFGGCLNVRPKRGGSSLSTHAFGAAIDTDPARNSLRSNKQNATLANPVCDKFWQAWTDEGWLSLGKARDFDWMHVQAVRFKGN